MCRMGKRRLIDLTADSSEEECAAVAMVDLTASEVDLTASEAVVGGSSIADGTAAGGSSSDRSIKECPVCISPLGSDGPVQALGCFHVFCRACIARCIVSQLEMQRQPDCPVCKRAIPEDEQRACGVEPPSHSAAYAGTPLDMFEDAEEPGSRAREEVEARRAAFPHVPSRAIWQSRASDPMRLLDRHLQQQRREGGRISYGGRGRQSAGALQVSRSIGVSSAGRQPRGAHARGSARGRAGRSRPMAPSWP